MDEWTVAFDLMEDGIPSLFDNWLGLAVPPFLLMISAIFLVYNRTFAEMGVPFHWSTVVKIRRIGSVVFYGIFFLIILYVTVSMFWSILSNHFELRRAYLQHTYTVVEGRVQDYQSTPGPGYYEEEFTVNGTRFAYSSVRLMTSFNRPQELGGPIREGIYVRIWHVHGDIIRLEIRK